MTANKIGFYLLNINSSTNRNIVTVKSSKYGLSNTNPALLGNPKNKKSA